jgi:predicted enzyme related to lactoylglutathione lyase
MKKSIFLALALMTSFGLGFALNSFVSQEPKTPMEMKKVTGIGGVFFKCKDPKKMNEWYKKHLGLNTNPYGASFEWYEEPDSTKKAMTQWTPFDETTKYFEPSSKDFMINYRVENLEALIEQLKAEGVTIVDKMETYDYGKFVHILDAEGNKVELWEPIDSSDKK